MTELEDQIGKQAMLRNAQATDSENRAFFQKKINDLTDELRRLAEAIPQLQGLDEKIERAELGVHLAARDLHSDGALPSSAIWCGGLGVPMTLLSLVWMPTVFLPVIGVALILVAVFFLVTSMRIRRFASEHLDDAHQDLADLQRKRKSLVQSLTTSTDTLPLVDSQPLAPTAHGLTLVEN
jgi:hypothetical protein